MCGSQMPTFTSRFFYHVGSRYRTQVVRLGSKYPYPLGSLGEGRGSGRCNWLGVRFAVTCGALHTWNVEANFWIFVIQSAHIVLTAVRLP